MCRCLVGRPLFISTYVNDDGYDRVWKSEEIDVSHLKGKRTSGMHTTGQPWLSSPWQPRPEFRKLSLASLARMKSESTVS